MKPEDVAFQTMVAAWVAAVATALAAIFAAFAVWFAKRAAEKAGLQAQAAMEAVTEARNQVGLMRQEMEWAEPQPVIIVDISLAIPAGQHSIQFENVGESLAFDLEVSDILCTSDPVKNITTRLHFVREPFLKIGQRQGIKVLPTQGNPLGRPSPEMEVNKLFDVLRSEVAASRDDGIVRFNNLVQLRPIVLRYRNARGKSFETPFMLIHTELGGFQIIPEWSLLPNLRPQGLIR
jgi:hypothetical protein